MGAQKLKCIDKWAVDIDEIGVFLEGSSIAVRVNGSDLRARDEPIWLNTGLLPDDIGLYGLRGEDVVTPHLTQEQRRIVARYGVGYLARMTRGKLLVHMRKLKI